MLSQHLSVFVVVFFARIGFQFILHWTLYFLPIVKYFAIKYSYSSSQDEISAFNIFRIYDSTSIEMIPNVVNVL